MHPADPIGYQIRAAEVTCWGLCPECAAEVVPPAEQGLSCIKERNAMSDDTMTGCSIMHGDEEGGQQGAPHGGQET